MEPSHTDDRPLRAFRYLVWLVAVALLSAAPRPAAARCTNEERLKLFDDGWSKARVDDFCGSAGGATDPSSSRSDREEQSARSSPVGVATVCATPAGTCALTVRGVRGGYCTCFTPAGAFYGIAQ
jgi:hypothetical protein